MLYQLSYLGISRSNENQKSKTRGRLCQVVSRQDRRLQTRTTLHFAIVGASNPYQPIPYDARSLIRRRLREKMTLAGQLAHCGRWQDRSRHLQRFLREGVAGSAAYYQDR